MIEVFKKDLAGYKLSKGTIQFPLDQPLPFDLITRIVLHRVMENQQAATKKQAATKIQHVATRRQAATKIQGATVKKQPATKNSAGGREEAAEVRQKSTSGQK